MINLNMKILCAFACAVLLLNGCASGDEALGGRYSQRTAISGKNGTYKIGKPYKIMGKWYYPKEDYSYSEVGMASWYGEDFHAKYTANGEIYDMNTLTAAHRTLPLPSIVRVTNLENGRSLVLRVNDRGPFAKNRIIDISKRGAQLLGYKEKGITKVRVEILEEESRKLKAAITGDCYEPVRTAAAAPIKKMPSYQPADPLELRGAEAVGSGNYFVQAGSFASRNGADALKGQLNRFGNASIMPADINGSRFYRVRLGPYSHQTEADIALAKIKNFGVYNAKVVQD